ncbi:hypothetical protein AN618_21470 [Fervidicola ferrireducens]|uniref:Uncharacterized protein n=1 Tax=Fervidicola ferrireducens TaxID=520764 RepID=A0A140L2T0_9FIRM|nr:hypothetical protein [Fervidicola ferrireducens]KXG74855.1 hypothetical protein AN618_21470 [Fervidicola ferrireducens]
MVKFLTVLSFFALLSVLYFFYFGGKNFEVIRKGGKAKKWSETAQRRFTIAVRLFFKALGVALLVFVVIPMVRDIPDLQKGRFEVIEGVPDYITKPVGGFWFYRQTVTIDGKRAVFYFHSYRTAARKPYPFKGRDESGGQLC